MVRFALTHPRKAHLLDVRLDVKCLVVPFEADLTTVIPADLNRSIAEWGVKFSSRRSVLRCGRPQAFSLHGRTTTSVHALVISEELVAEVERLIVAYELRGEHQISCTIAVKGSSEQVNAPQSSSHCRK